MLRRNCETDWAQKYPQYAVSIWIGHDITVSAKHYLQVPEELYSKLTTATSTPLLLPVGDGQKFTPSSRSSPELPQNLPQNESAA